MPDEPNTIQEPSVVDTPQSSESQVPIAPPEAPEASGNGDMAESNKEAPPRDSEIRVESGNEPKTLENQGVVNPAPEIVNSPMRTAQTAPAPESVKAQMAGNEPLTQNEPAKIEPLTPEPVASEAKPVETETNSQSSSPQEAKPSVVAQSETFKNHTRENLVKAQQTIQNRKRNKLNMVLNLFAKRKSIKNDELLRVMID